MAIVDKEKSIVTITLKEYEDLIKHYEIENKKIIKLKDEFNRDKRAYEEGLFKKTTEKYTNCFSTFTTYCGKDNAIQDLISEKLKDEIQKVIERMPITIFLKIRSEFKKKNKK